MYRRMVLFFHPIDAFRWTGFVQNESENHVYLGYFHRDYWRFGL
jgi:hypothetical protein